MLLKSHEGADTGAGDRTRWPICPWGKSYRCHQFLNWWPPNATGIWHLNGFESWPHQKQKAPPLGGTFCFWCGRQDSNLHAFAEEPKSTESTNSTTPACSFVPLIFTRRRHPRSALGADLRCIKNRKICFCPTHCGRKSFYHGHPLLVNPMAGDFLPKNSSNGENLPLTFGAYLVKITLVWCTLLAEAKVFH